MIEQITAILNKYNLLEVAIRNNSSIDDYVKMLTGLIESHQASIQAMIDFLSYEEQIQLHSQLMARPHKYLEAILALEATMDETQLTASKIMS